MGYHEFAVELKSELRKKSECLEELAMAEGEIRGDKEMNAEEIINSAIGRDSKPLFWLLFSLGVIPKWVGPFLVYISIFTGFVPYTKWTCLSDRCLDLLANSTTPQHFYSEKTMCENNLLPRLDFMWTENRTTYAMDWDLICSAEKKGSFMTSLFFLGSILGLILGTILFERIGRKSTVLLGILVCGLASFVNAFIRDYSVMVVFRVFQGLGAFMADTGCSLLAVELTPSFRRNPAQLGQSLTWTTGSAVIIGIAYLLRSWHHIYLIVGVLIFLITIPLLAFPESPRFHLVQGEEKKARKTFRRLTRLFSTPLDLDNVSISYTNYRQSYLSQLGDFVRYPNMLSTTLILMAGWMIISSVSYGLVYSWGRLGGDLYLSILLSNVGSLLSEGTGFTYMLIHKLGRKWSLVANFGLVAAFFFLSVIEVELGSVWTVRQVMCLCATPFLSSLWGCLNLITSELAPTSHRGMIMAACSTAARIGAVCGPYLTLLYSLMESWIVLCLFGGLSVLAAGILLLCPDSTGKTIPQIPEEMQGGRIYKKLGAEVVRT